MRAHHLRGSRASEPRIHHEGAAKGAIAARWSFRRRKAGMSLDGHRKRRTANVSHKHLIGRLFRLISGLDLIASRHSHKTHHSLESQS